MNETKYLIDNHVLGFLGPKRRASDYFLAHCRVPQEVVHEARYAKYNDSLKPLSEAMTPAVLQQLKVVMKTVPVGDTSLIDLYANKGAADPVLVATVLELTNPAVPLLFADTWIIVTRDGAVRAKAEEFAIGTMTPDELAAVIDLSSN